VSAICALRCAPHYINQHGLPFKPEDLAHHHQVGYVLASTGKVRPVTLIRDGGRVEFDVPARFQTTDSSAALSAGLDGLGIVVLAEFVASYYLTSGALLRVLPGWQCPSLPLHLVTSTSRKRASRMQACMVWTHALLIRRLGPPLETQ
jgi:LysR family transcriptional regulator for bpeEF and oprC